MRRALAAPALFLALAAAAAAAPLAPEGAPLDAVAFEARVTGRTFFYNVGGRPYGAEQYLPGRQVVWAFTGQDCRRGRWYEEAGLICFVYEDEPDPQCWTFAEGPQGLTARFQGDPGSLPLIAVQQSPEPMACMGPDVGV